MHARGRPATCYLRTPHARRSSTHNTVQRSPHRCDRHRQAPCTLSRPATHGRRQPPRRRRL